MTDHPHSQYPVFVMCGRDPKRRRLMMALDPQEHYKVKALLPFLGKRLIDWQLEELRKSPYVEGLYLIGVSEEDIRFDYPVHYVPAETTSGFADKLIAGMAYLNALGMAPDQVVVSSSDAPAIKVGEINTFFEALNKNQPCDFFVSLVPEEIAEKEFPKSGRAVARFCDHHVFPGELYVLSPKAIAVQKDVIEELGQRRRKINRNKKKVSLGPMIRFVAKRPKTWVMIIKYLLGRATLADGEKALSKAFNLVIRTVVIPDVGFGMDMDLPEDYERLKAYVKKTKVVPEG